MTNTEEQFELQFDDDGAVRLLETVGDDQVVVADARAPSAAVAEQWADSVSNRLSASLDGHELYGQDTLVNSVHNDEHITEHGTYTPLDGTVYSVLFIDCATNPEAWLLERIEEHDVVVGITKTATNSSALAWGVDKVEQIQAL